MSRKKRRSGLFDLDRVKEKIKEENVCFNRVKEQLKHACYRAMIVFRPSTQVHSLAPLRHVVTFIALKTLKIFRVLFKIYSFIFGLIYLYVEEKET